MLFDELEPISDVERFEMATAKLMALTYNLGRPPKTPPATAQDFLPSWLKSDIEKSPEDLLNIIVGINAAFGGTDIRERKPD